ncbi:MAG TPA: acyltransferase [Actinomycetota bacterium]|nr:acyltransferase [Actinomycetota bacterium]
MTDAPPVDRRLGYHPALDGIRAVAVLLVLTFHTSEFPTGGFLGVDVFFVLSGFLITTLLLQEWDERGGVSLRRFYMRRFLRLFPALAALVAVYLVASAVLGDLDGRRVASGFYSLTYVANWVVAFDAPFHKDALVHLWSVAVEEQFYLLWPSVLVLVAARRPRSLGAVTTGLIAIVAVWRLSLELGGTGFERIYFALDTRFDELLVGCLGAILFVRHRSLLEAVPAVAYRAATVATVAGLGVAVFVLPHPNSHFLALGGYTLVAAGVLSVILTCVLGKWDLVRALLALPPLVFVGKISYSLYLWHVVVIFFLHDVIPFGSFEVATALWIAVSFAAACASYFWVERPFLKLKERYASRRVVVAERGPARLPFDPDPVA